MSESESQKRRYLYHRQHGLCVRCGDPVDTGLPAEQREVVRCPGCQLNQLMPHSRQCRRCHVALEYPPGSSAHCPACKEVCRLRKQAEAHARAGAEPDPALVMEVTDLAALPTMGVQ